jgi:Lon protease-like protein
MYEEGWAVARNYIKAYQWYALSARNPQQEMAIDPNYDPKAALERLVRRMNDFQIKRGKQHAKTWKPSR